VELFMEGGMGIVLMAKNSLFSFFRRIARVGGVLAVEAVPAAREDADIVAASGVACPGAGVFCVFCDFCAFAMRVPE
jgi:hypothetical protein